jgi:hypothetical protein
MEVAKQRGQNIDGRVPKDSSTPFEWFVRNRYFFLRQGDWRPETAKEKMSKIELDLIGKFGELRHAKADITADEYMQALREIVMGMVVR